MAADLVGRRVSVLVAVGGDPSARAAKHATSTIRIVFGVGGDPVSEGLGTSIIDPLSWILIPHAHDRRGDAAPRRRVMDRIAGIEKPSVAEDRTEHSRRCGADMRFRRRDTAADRGALAAHATVERDAGLYQQGRDVARV
jgi:hypothetical protein